jgi:hypothetical protein
LWPGQVLKQQSGNWVKGAGVAKGNCGQVTLKLQRLRWWGGWQTQATDTWQAYGYESASPGEVFWYVVSVACLDVSRQGGRRNHRRSQDHLLIPSLIVFQP